MVIRVWGCEDKRAIGILVRIAVLNEILLG